MQKHMIFLESLNHLTSASIKVPKRQQLVPVTPNEDVQSNLWP